MKQEVYMFETKKTLIVVYKDELLMNQLRHYLDEVRSGWYIRT